MRAELVHPKRLLEDPRHWRYLVGTTLIGMIALGTMSALQKWLIGAPVLSPVGYIVPALFGGGTGAIYGYFSVGRKRRLRALERETEIRRLISSVNHSLVRAEDVAEMASRITDILGSSSLFTCTCVYFADRNAADVNCVSTAELSQSAVTSLHTDRYVDAVFEAQALRIADVTERPHQHHNGASPPHSGVGIAIGHQGEQYGVLTVHFPPGVDPTDEEIELLETIGSDFGYFIHTRILESERQAFAEIVERIDDPVMIQGLDGTFQVVNEAVMEFAGLDKSELLEVDESAFMDAAAARTVQTMKDRVIETKSPVTYQLTPTFPDGRERTYSTTRYPSFDAAGNVEATIAICRDITDLETHQRQLRVLDRVLRHNVNNNMNVVQGYAEMIREEASDPAKTHASKIATNSERLIDIAHKQRKITEFLSKSEPRQNIDLQPLVKQVTDHIRSDHPEATVTLTCPGAVTVFASKSITEAIEELLSNSIIHASEPDPNPTLTVSQTGATVRIQVTDENPIISKMDRSVLEGTDELSALRHGSGLGLWLVKLIVDRSDGRLTYEELEPRGNCISIELEAAEPTR